MHVALINFAYVHVIQGVHDPLYMTIDNSNTSEGFEPQTSLYGHNDTNSCFTTANSLTL